MVIFKITIVVVVVLQMLLSHLVNCWIAQWCVDLWLQSQRSGVQVSNVSAGRRASLRRLGPATRVPNKPLLSNLCF